MGKAGDGAGVPRLKKPMRGGGRLDLSNSFTRKGDQREFRRVICQ